MLLDHSDRIDLIARDNIGETALIMACRYGNKNAVQLLLHHSDIDLDIKDNSGRTALMIARQSEHQDIVARLKIAKACKSNQNQKQTEATSNF